MTQLRKKFRQFIRLATHTQLLPILESGDDPLIGGQAVIEGVMMRAPHSYCVTVRRADGTTATDQGLLERPSEKYKVLGWPVIRGVGTLGQAMSLGIKTLRFSANQALIDEAEPASSGAESRSFVAESSSSGNEKNKNDESKNEAVKEETKSSEISGWMMTLNVIFSIAFFIFLYKFIPLVITTQIQEHSSWLSGNIAFNLVDGVIRLAIFLTFLVLISRMEDIRRVFQYHGAEHKVVFNYESGKPVDVPTSQAFTTFHPRCGTSFLMVVMLISIVVYSLIPVEGFALRFLMRILLLPVIAGISYEVIRFAAKHQGTLWSSMVLPGLWLQRITTKDPADDQVEISIQSLEAAMALEKEQNGELVVA
jgi:uncharacterized protein YqhQ